LKRVSYELLTLPLPFVLWFVTFRVPFLGFWPTLTASASVLLVVSFPRWGGANFNVDIKQIAIGIATGILLYIFFWTGYQVAKNIPGFTQTISSVYGLRGGIGTTQIAEVLLFPIGPAEELYWRGMVQGYFKERLTPRRAILITSSLYTLIHLPTFNPSLLFVALVGGLVWGYLFNRFGRILPVIASHALFDEMIFVLFVIS
jgi:membrane protease YdiL (CAAX protease family)